MGTKGYRVYRYKGRYFIIYNHSDSYPEDLGIKVAAEVPALESEFEAYVAAKKKELQKKLDEGFPEDIRMSEIDIRMREEPPRNGISVHWMYEIDLDHYIFFVDGEPLFDLRNMLYGDDFVACIDYDNYGRRSFCSITPEEYRYKLPPPLPVDPDVLSTYKGYHVTCCRPHEVLGIPLEMRPIEVTRMKIMQLFVATSMAGRAFSNSDGLGVNAVLSSTVAFNVIFRMRAICGVFSGPLIFADDHPKLDHSNRSDEPFQWLEDQFCMLVVPRLDSEATLHAAIVQLVEKVTRHFESHTCTDGTVLYAAVLSLYHVSIVHLKVVEPEQIRERVFHLEHTPSLQLLPTEHATIPFTPGIEALARLGQIIFENSPQCDLVSKYEIYHRTASVSKIGSLPTELCLSIAQHLSPKTLQDFAKISPSWASAASDFLCHPYFEYGRRVLPAPPPVYGEGYSYDPYERRRTWGNEWYRLLPGNVQFESLYSCIFGALDRNGHRVTLFLNADLSSSAEIDRIEEDKIRNEPDGHPEIDVGFCIGPVWCEDHGEEDKDDISVVMRELRALRAQ